MRFRFGVSLAFAAFAAFLFPLAAIAVVPVGDQLRVSQTGVDGDPARGVSRGPGVAYNPQANEYLIVWSADGLATDNEYEIFGQRLSVAGAELEGDFRISTTGTDGDPDRRARNPSIAYNSQAAEYLVVWEADGLATDDEYEVFGQRLSAAGVELGGDFRISTLAIDGDSARRVEDPAVAYNQQTNEYLVVWEGDGQLNDNEYEIFGQLLSAGGGELGGDFRVSNTGTDGDVNRDAINAAVIFNSQANEYLVAWNGDGIADDEHELFGQRLSAAGGELGGDFRISNAGMDGDTNRSVGDPTLAYNSQANEYLAAWEADGLATDDEYEVFGQRLSAAGVELGGDFRISTTGSDGDANRSVEDPAVAYSTQSSEYLVVWEADGLATDNEYEVFGQGLTASGAALGGVFRISITGVDGDTAREVEEPALAHNAAANEYLVAWQADGLATNDEEEIFARRFGPEPPPTAGPCTITGTPGNDVLTGTPGPDRICALGGNDRVFGLGGNDRIVLGSGRDRAFGGRGRDVILGGKGPDRISGGGGRDRLFGQRGRDVLLARDRARDLVHGGRGFDRARVDRRRDVRRSIERLF
jgi:Ca2+-binding RTX toxin-like protein